MTLAALLLLMAPPQAADQLFKAPANRPETNAYNGQPTWMLMARCTKGSYEEAREYADEGLPVTATDEALARSYGLTVAEMREQDAKASMEAAERYASLAVARLAADRGIAPEAAQQIIAGQVEGMEAIRAGVVSDPCVAIAATLTPA